MVAATAFNSYGDRFASGSADGKIKVYNHLGDNKFAEGYWLQVEGKPAEVPGVW